MSTSRVTRSAGHCTEAALTQKRSYERHRSRVSLSTVIKLNSTKKIIETLKKKKKKKNVHQIIR